MIIYRGNTYTKLDQIIPVGNSAVGQSSERRHIRIEKWAKTSPPKMSLTISKYIHLPYLGDLVYVFMLRL